MTLAKKLLMAVAFVLAIAACANDRVAETDGLRFGELTPHPQFKRLGPEAAKGVVIWSHGRADFNQDSRQSPSHPYIARFAAAGFDIYRFDREPSSDHVEWATSRLLEGTRAMRNSGYKSIIAAGQSRGAWHSLAALRDPAALDGVIAAAPAAHGSTGGNVTLNGPDQFRSLFSRMENKQAKIAIFLFNNDPFDPDPAWRASHARSALMAKGNPNIILDRPAVASGHGGGASSAFDRRYGDCLLQFMLSGANKCP